MLFSMSNSIMAQDITFRKEYAFSHGIIWVKDFCKNSLSCKHRGSFTIPQTHQKDGKTYIVDEIHDSFIKCNLSSIVISNSVSSIGKSFQECKNLKTATLSTNLKKISKCFIDCGLTSVTIPNSVTRLSESFHRCNYLTSIIIPNSNNVEIYKCFIDCGLISVTIPNVDYIRDSFNDCKSLTSVTFTNSVTKVKVIDINNCFNDCGLTSVTVPNGFSFFECFNKCKSLTSVTLTDGSYISRCFNDCKSLISVTLTDGSHIRRCFNNCKSLTSVTIPNGVTDISESFNENYKSLSITIQNPTPPSCSSSFYNKSMEEFQKCTIYVPKGSISAYQKDETWGKFNIKEIE